MFDLKNAWVALTRHQWRTSLTIIITILVSATAVFAMSTNEANNQATGADYNAQKPNAEFRLTPAAATKRDGADSSWTKNYLGWNDYTKYATAAQVSGVDFTFTLSSTIPVRQSASFKPIATSSEPSADKTGGEFSLRAFYTADAAKYNDFGTFKIASGSAVDYTGQKNTDGAIISQALANQNKLKVGDKITVGNPTDANATYTFTIEGIYTYTGKQQSDLGLNPKLAKDNRDNAIYISYATLANEKLDKSDGTGWAIPDLNILFSFTSTSAYNNFAALAKKTGLPKNYQITSPSLDSYHASIAPLGNLVKNMRIPTIIGLSLGVVLLLVLTLLSTSGRREEIANNMVIGVSRARTGWQFMLEVFIVTIPALAIGITLGRFCSEPIGKSLTDIKLITPTSTIIWNTIWYGLSVILLMAFVALSRVIALRTAVLFKSREEA